MNKEKQILIDWLEAINYANNALIFKLKNLENNDSSELNQKYKVSEFAKLIGCTQKTIYQLIKRNEVETSIERIKGRPVSFIVASKNKIQEIRQNYI